LSIITGALFTAFSAPSSTPPTNGANATLPDTPYIGSASFLNLTLLYTSPPSSSSSSSSSTSSPSSSLVYYHSKNSSYTGCNNMPFTPTDNVVLMNPLQFGNASASNSTCGDWIQIQNRQNTELSTYAQIVGICDDCEYGSMDLSIGALNDLALDVPFNDLTFSNSSDVTISDLIEPDSSIDPSTTAISSDNLLDITWSLSDAPQSHNNNPTPTSTATPTTTSPTSTSTATPTPTTTPTTPPASQFSGRATWYSDTHGQCEHDYSQSDLIVAVNQDQMGTGKELCGKKILLTKKGSDVQVIATVVDMCPKQFCNFGDLDLSQAAFKKFAGLGVGILELQWSWL
jgi:expansin (peptidoglycan-binding protein)